MSSEKNNLNRTPINLLGLPIHAVTLPEAAEWIESAIQQRERCFLSTPNLNFTVMAQNDPAFYDSVLASDLVVADGMPLIWVAKFSGLPIQERVAGSDLFDYLSRQPREEKIRIFFFGGEPGIAERAFHQLNQTSVGFEACGFYDPGFVSVEYMSQPDIIQKINQSKADFIVVALGAKKGQQWIMQNQSQLDAPVISHLGAVINFVAGHVERAPERWQKFGLEWLWRIKQEPKLYKRYLFDGLTFLKMLFTQVLPLRIYKAWLKHQAKDVQWQAEIIQQDDKLTLWMSGQFTKETLPELEKYFAALLAGGGEDIIVDQQIDYLDESIIARLSYLQGQLNQQGRILYLRAVSRKLERLLRFSSVLKHFKLI